MDCGAVQKMVTKCMEEQRHEIWTENEVRNGYRSSAMERMNFISETNAGSNGLNPQLENPDSPLSTTEALENP